MAAVESDWEEIPSYSNLIKEIYGFLEKTYRDTFVDKKEPHPIELTWRYYNFSSYDLLLVVLFAIVWTVLRHLATEWIFKPLAHYYALTPTNQKKMPESAWKFLFYLSAWCYSCYVVILSGKYRFFQQPSTVWQNNIRNSEFSEIQHLDDPVNAGFPRFHYWNLDVLPPTDIYFMYMIQCGFYVHSLYATLFLDTWRKDSLVMMIHHVLTVMLISFSYSLRYHNIGCLVVFLHDGCDVFLEFTKLNVYFKIQGNKVMKRHEIMANITFFCFTVAWFVNRLYWYPLRVLWTATADVQRMQLILPCALLMNCLLWILQILNIYWFLFIVQFLYRVATGQVKEIDDTREYDVEEKFSKLASSSSNHKDIALQNGFISKNGSCDGTQYVNGEVSKKES